MATAPKTTAPAKPAATQPDTTKAKRNAPADIDLSALSVTTAPAPRPASGAGRKAEDNSTAEKWVRESWAERKEGEPFGGGRALPVPTAAAGTVVSKLRRAAKTLKLGLAVKVIDGPAKAPNGTDIPTGQSVVNFAAKTAKQTKKSDSNN